MTVYVCHSNSVLNEAPALTRYLEDLGLFAQADWRQHGPGQDVTVWDPPPVGGYCGAALWVARGARRGAFNLEQLEWGRNLSDRAWAVAWCAGVANAIRFLSGLGYGKNSVGRWGS